jgi:hypothetical protein
MKVVLTLILSLTSPSQAFALARDADCPELNPRDMTQWRDMAVNALVSRSLTQTELRDKIEECFPSDRPACFNRLSEQLGGPRPTRFEYPASIAAEMRNPPAEFRAPNSDGNDFRVPANLEALARERGWDFVKFKTRGNGGFDAMTTSLYLFSIPGSSFNPPLNYDRYIQFSLAPDPASRRDNPVPSSGLPTRADYAREEESGSMLLPKTFSMITMERGQNGAPNRPYFQLFERQTAGSGVFTRQGPQDESSCYSCHPSGMRAISPLGYWTQPGEAKLPQASQDAVRKINDAMDYGNVQWRRAGSPPRPFVRPEDSGPPFGPVPALNPTSRTEAFINQCATSQREISVEDTFSRDGLERTFSQSSPPSIRWQKVRDAMNCASCHDGKSRGIITSAVSNDALHFKILVDRTMPMFGGDDLTVDERIALINCLKAEAVVERPYWLKQQACTIGTPGRTAGGATPPGGSVNDRRTASPVESPAPSDDRRPANPHGVERAT